MVQIINHISGVIIKRPFGDVYDIIAEWLNQYAEDRHIYDDFIIKLRLNGVIMIEYAEMDEFDISYSFIHDWYEGETIVELMDIKPLLKVF